MEYRETDDYVQEVLKTCQNESDLVLKILEKTANVLELLTKKVEDHATRISVLELELQHFREGMNNEKIKNT